MQTESEQEEASTGSDSESVNKSKSKKANSKGKSKGKGKSSKSKSKGKGKSKSSKSKSKKSKDKGNKGVRGGFVTWAVCAGVFWAQHSSYFICRLNAEVKGDFVVEEEGLLRGVLMPFVLVGGRGGVGGWW